MVGDMRWGPRGQLWAPWRPLGVGRWRVGHSFRGRFCEVLREPGVPPHGPSAPTRLSSPSWHVSRSVWLEPPHAKWKDKHGGAQTAVRACPLWVPRATLLPPPPRGGRHHFHAQNSPGPAAFSQKEGIGAETSPRGLVHSRGTSSTVAPSLGPGQHLFQWRTERVACGLEASRGTHGCTSIIIIISPARGLQWPLCALTTETSNLFFLAFHPALVWPTRLCSSFGTQHVTFSPAALPALSATSSSCTDSARPPGPPPFRSLGVPVTHSGRAVPELAPTPALAGSPPAPRAVSAQRDPWEPPGGKHREGRGLAWASPTRDPAQLARPAVTRGGTAGSRKG